MSANLQKMEIWMGTCFIVCRPKWSSPSIRGISPFDYNKFEDLKALVDTHNIGVIKMEVSRNLGPEDNFLEKVRTLATKKYRFF